MEPFVIPIDQFQNFILCFARVMALIGGIPVFSGTGVITRSKIGIAFLTAIVLFPVMKPYTPTEVNSMFELGFLLINEVILGLLISLVAQIVLAGISFGGTVIGYQMGFAAANILDPQTTQQLSLMSQFINVFAILLFLTMNVHYFFFDCIVDSYKLLPPGYLDFSGGAIPKLMTLGSNLFILGIKFCAPILILLLLSTMVLGILSRVFPQLNVFMISFPINIGTSFVVISLTLGVTANYLRHEFDNIIPTIIELFHLFKG